MYKVEILILFPFFVSSVLSFPYVARQSELLNGLGNANTNYYYDNSDEDHQIPIQQKTTKQTTTAPRTSPPKLRQEIKQEITKFNNNFAQKQEELGQPITTTEKQELEMQPEHRPWHKRLKNWFRKAYNSAETAVKGVFKKREVKVRDQRGYHAYSF